MRNWIRQPLPWMVIAECVVVALLIVVVWNVVAAAAAQHPAATPAQAINSVTAPSDSPLPEVPVGAQAARQVQLPGLNLDPRVWRVRPRPPEPGPVFFWQPRMSARAQPECDRPAVPAKPVPP